MKKLLLAALLLISFNTHAYKYYYGFRPYHVAATITNPLSATFKYGGGLEVRFRNVSYLPTYIKYKGGVYPGFQAGLDLRIYLRRRYIYPSTGIGFQNFVFIKGVAGTAGFDGPKLSSLGYEAKTVLPETGYFGAGAGIGRRYTKGVLFLTAKAGLKYCVLPEFGPGQEADKNLYRLFYVTGPGSILEVQFQLGLQL